MQIQEQEPEPKPPPPRRVARLAFRLPSAQAEDWRLRAEQAGLSLSDFVRSAVDARQATGISPPNFRRYRRTYTAADPALILGIARLGSNLNQIARQCHAHEKAIDRVLLLAQLASIEKTLLSLLPQARANERGRVASPGEGG